MGSCARFIAPEVSPLVYVIHVRSFKHGNGDCSVHGTLCDRLKALALYPVYSSCVLSVNAVNCACPRYQCIIVFVELCCLVFTIPSLESGFETKKMLSRRKTITFSSYTCVQTDEMYLHVQKYLPSAGNVFWWTGLPRYSCTRIPAKPVFPVQQVSRCRNISVTWAIT